MTQKYHWGESKDYSHLLDLSIYTEGKITPHFTLTFKPLSNKELLNIAGMMVPILNWTKYKMDLTYSNGNSSCPIIN